MTLIPKNYFQLPYHVVSFSDSNFKLRGGESRKLLGVEFARKLVSAKAQKAAPVGLALDSVNVKREM